MSQHKLPPNNAHADHVIIVGWDRPTLTFYARIHRVTTNGPAHVLWVGRPSAQVGNSSVIMDAIEPFVDTAKVELHAVGTALFCDMVETLDGPAAEPNRMHDWDPTRFDSGSDPAGSGIPAQRSAS
jgi:hypothetical protein